MQIRTIEANEVYKLTDCLSTLIVLITAMAMAAVITSTKNAQTIPTDPSNTPPTAGANSMSTELRLWFIPCIFVRLSMGTSWG